jgi:2-oxo-4-hydroxy-4-carboxy-5-ureidoimidazoline decarboxylase
MKLEALNQAAEETFLGLIGGPLEGETWLAARIFPRRPFTSVDDLYAAFEAAVEQTDDDEKIKLITSHPDLAGKAKISPTSISEQAAAGLDRLTPEEYTAFTKLNTAYKTRFGFPFVLCARENTKDTILAGFRERLHHSRRQEIDIAICEVLKILKLRLIDQFNE